MGRTLALHGTVLAQSKLTIDADAGDFSGTWTISPTASADMRSLIRVAEARITAPLLINGGGEIEIYSIISILSGASITVANGTTLITQNQSFELSGGDLNMHGHFIFESGGGDSQ